MKGFREHAIQSIEEHVNHPAHQGISEEYTNAGEASHVRGLQWDSLL